MFEVEKERASLEQDALRPLSLGRYMRQVLRMEPRTLNAVPTLRAFQMQKLNTLYQKRQEEMQATKSPALTIVQYPVIGAYLSAERATLLRQAVSLRGDLRTALSLEPRAEAEAPAGESGSGSGSASGEAKDKLGTPPPRDNTHSGSAFMSNEAPYSRSMQPRTDGVVRQHRSLETEIFAKMSATAAARALRKNRISAAGGTPLLNAVSGSPARSKGRHSGTASPKEVLLQSTEQLAAGEPVAGPHDQPGPSSQEPETMSDSAHHSGSMSGMASPAAELDGTESGGEAAGSADPRITPAATTPPGK